MTKIFPFRGQAGTKLRVVRTSGFEITRSQGLEKFKMAAIFVKITEPCQKPFDFVVRHVSDNMYTNHESFGPGVHEITRPQGFVSKSLK